MNSIPDKLLSMCHMGSQNYVIHTCYYLVESEFNCYSSFVTVATWVEIHAEAGTGSGPDQDYES